MKNIDNKKSERVSDGNNKCPVYFKCDFLLILIIFFVSFAVETYLRTEKGAQVTSAASIFDTSWKTVNTDSEIDFSQEKGKSGGYSIFEGTMADMTWQEIEKAAKEKTPVLLPIAVIEEHGPHMVNGIDTYLGYLTCRLIKENLDERDVDVLIAPPFYWGINASTHVFPGTFTVRDETMKMLLHDIFVSLQSWGFNDVFLFISHGDQRHNQVTFRSVVDSRRDLDINAKIFFPESDLGRSGLTGREPFLLPYSYPGELPDTQYMDIHAGAFETGIVAAYFPDLVDEDLARSLTGTEITPQDIGKWARDAKKYSPLGYVGDPAKFDAAEAGEFWNDLCKNLADAVEKAVK